MKPVAIFRFNLIEGPGYFVDYLDQQQIPWTLLAMDRGDAVPPDAGAYAGICLMGGSMSVNDPLPWIEPVCALVRDAVSRGVPVIGHCLGGQLMSKSLGGQVVRNPVKEIGWSTLEPLAVPAASEWLGSFTASPLTVFQWHGETFSLPDGAILLARNDFCGHQMFVMGPHFGMQCHVEMTPAMIADWCEHWEEETAAETASGARVAIETPDCIDRQLPDALPALHRLADQVYGQWVKGLVG
jgi:GMP synthase-like glutamine amidotransferase